MRFLIFAVLLVTVCDARGSRGHAYPSPRPDPRSLPEASVTLIGLPTNTNTTYGPRPSVSHGTSTGTGDNSGSDGSYQTGGSRGEPHSSTSTSSSSEQMPPSSQSGSEFTRQVPLCILVDVIDDPYDDRMRTGFKYGKTFIPRVG